MLRAAQITSESCVEFVLLLIFSSAVKVTSADSVACLFFLLPCVMSDNGGWELKKLTSHFYNLLLWLGINQMLV